MKGFLVLTLVGLAAVSAYAYAPADVTLIASALPGEPASLLLSGSALIGVAGAVRRLG